MLKKLNKQNFDNTIKSHPHTLVKFGAIWCGPCKMVSNILTQIKDIEVYEVDVDEEYDLVEKYKIAHLPTILIFDNNINVIKQFVGSINKDELNAFITTLHA